MNKRSYKAFTLIEMLIVMGILIILMAVGVAAGRFAIDRANEISHKNGATQLYQALQAYYTDNLQFPEVGANFKGLLGTQSNPGILYKYLDMGSFKGGSNATYYYFVDKEKQSTIVCVTLGGEQDSGEKGLVCVGNGFDKVGASCVAETDKPIKKEKYEGKDTDEEFTAIKLIVPGSGTCASNWDSKLKSF